MAKAAQRIILLITLLMLVACGGPDSEYVADGAELTTLYSSGDWGSQIYRFVDGDTGVVCWIFVGPYRGGIHCLPLDQTRWD